MVWIAGKIMESSNYGTRVNIGKGGHEQQWHAPTYGYTIDERKLRDEYRISQRTRVFSQSRVFA